VPTYTALNSSPTSGLFRGNPDLGREYSRNLEVGLSADVAGWLVEATAFYRRDKNLVDWTFAQGVTARTANAVDLSTQGVELVAKRKARRYDLVFGYTALAKAADYGSAVVDASFYALNFAKQRLTAAVVLRVGNGVEVRVDNEYRIQEPNVLRVVGGNAAFLSSVGLYYLTPWRRGLEFSLLVDNIWNSVYQEVPAVPASRRQFSVGATYRW
jgi:outer membrane receptor protein involved in Fe transport